LFFGIFQRAIESFWSKCSKGCLNVSGVPKVQSHSDFYCDSGKLIGVIGGLSW